LKENKVEAVAKEITGVYSYRKSIFNIHEEDFPVSIANHKYLKKVPGKRPVSVTVNGFRTFWEIFRISLH
jgi:hypothetical protein